MFIVMMNSKLFNTEFSSVKNLAVMQVIYDPAIVVIPSKVEWCGIVF